VTTPISNEIEALPNVVSTETNDFHFDWDPTAVELMHNYSTITCFSLAEDPALHTFYQVDVPKIGFSHTHVLHLLLSISAMHLSRFRPKRQTFYLEHAEKHSQAGFRIATRLLPNVNQENCHSLFLFGSLSCSFIVIKGPSPSSFLLFDDEGPAEWISLFRGIQTVVQLHHEDILNGILPPLIKIGISAALQEGNSLPSWESDQLARLRLMVDSTSTSREDSQILNLAVDNLIKLFSSRIGSDGRKVSLQFQSIGVWIYRSTDEFVALLQKRHPAALAIFAHACIPLNDVSSHWTMAGWIPHLLTGIWERLPQEYHQWIQWPIQQIGWIPSEP
jgi:hypothetical protein